MTSFGNLASRLSQAAFLAFSIGFFGAAATAQDRVRIAPLGNKVELKLETALVGKEYVLESVARVMEGEEWAPLLQFRGGDTPRPFVDPICGTAETRFFRLRQLLEAPPVEVSNFRLLDVNGNAFELYYEQPAKAVLVILTGTKLEAAMPMLPELDRIRELAGEEDLPIWILSASATAQRETIAEIANTFPANFPVLQDPSSAVHRTLGSGQVPEAVLVSTANWSVAFRGPVEEIIDTGIGTIRNQPLSSAVAEVLNGSPVEVSRMAVTGTPAGLPSIKESSYSDRIAPMLLTSCMPCHSQGNIAPWVMENHGVIREYARLIKSAVLTGDMPPWHADPAYQKFSNAKGLPPEDVAALVGWIDRGAPRGDGPDPLALAHANHEPQEDWPLGQPDAIISITPQDIPATGVIDYRYLIARSPFPADTWLRAVVVKPGDRSVVHHSLVFKGGIAELIAFQGGLSGFFAGYVPGMDQVPFPEGTGKLLKKSDTIVFQMHYTASGKAATDATQLGLYLANEQPKQELVTTAAYDTRFAIPPQTARFPVSASMTFANRSTIYELSPHMHYRGESARFTLVYPDGVREVLLNVPKYFFDWQALYRLATPKEVPAGTRLLAEGAFDNSIRNRFNPDPSATVKFGEQSWEEMFIGYVNFAQTE